MCLTADPGVDSSIPTLSHTFAEIDHEIIFTASLIQEGLLSVTSESICTKYWLTAKSSFLRIKVWLREVTVMTIAVDWEVKHQTKQTKKNNFNFFLRSSVIFSAVSTNFFRFKYNISGLLPSFEFLNFLKQEIDRAGVIAEVACISLIYIVANTMA